MASTGEAAAGPAGGPMTTDGEAGGPIGPGAGAGGPITTGGAGAGWAGMAGWATATGPGGRLRMQPEVASAIASATRRRRVTRMTHTSDRRQPGGLTPVRVKKA